MLAAELPIRLGRSPLQLRVAPTPVEPLPGGSWVMREDAAGGDIGGSKLRKLEWCFADSPAGDVITLGPAGGLHLVSAAVVGRALGVRVHAVAWPQPWLPGAEANLQALHAHAENVWASRSRAHALARLARLYATVRVQSGERPAVWGPGASDAAGTLGWAHAAMELAERAAAGEFPLPGRVVLAQGSGGTAAGLQLGFALAGVPTEVHAVDVTGFGAALVRAQSARACRVLEEAGVVVPRLPVFRCVAEPSPYGVPTAAGGGAAAWAAANGFAVDPVYSAKALAWALSGGGAFLFVATANGRPMAPLLRSALPELPARLAALWG